ncbi:unnamed protein product [Fraxinus pennsylvanica]|uniref:Uncharacterized protein n=1 Tax=Fraxinus pennsylvanica TaxID=56036 RepID=A0AAD2DTU6_9LAMI|nr:unnamed protein product [Fraxinus pennsylvanica]
MLERNTGSKNLVHAPRLGKANAAEASAVEPTKMCSSSLKPAEKLRVDTPSCYAPPSKKQKTEMMKKLAFDHDEEDLSQEVLNMLSAYFASTVDTMYKYNGIREVERLVSESDREVLNSSVYHLMKAAVFMAEHAHRMVDLNEANQKTREELNDARKEIADLHREKEKTRQELDDAQTEIVVLRREKEKTREALDDAQKEIVVLCREKEKSWEELSGAQTELAIISREKEKIREEMNDAQIEIAALCRNYSNTSRSASRAWQENAKLQEELKKLKGLGAEVEKLKAEVATKETEASMAVKAFKNSEEFEVLRENLFQAGAHALYDAIEQEHPDWDLSCFVETDNEDEDEDHLRVAGLGVVENCETFLTGMLKWVMFCFGWPKLVGWENWGVCGNWNGLLQHGWSLGTGLSVVTAIVREEGYWALAAEDAKATAVREGSDFGQEPWLSDCCYGM